MNCVGSRDWMHREIDGELSRAEQAALEAHLAGCDRCRRHREQLRLVRDAVTELARVTDGAVPDVELPAPRTIPLWPAWAAAALITLSVGAWLFTQSTAPQPEPGPPVIAESPEPKGDSEEANEPAPWPAGKASVTFANAEDLIVVPHETEHPSVTIIWVYETYRTANAQNPPEAQSSS